MANIGLAVQGSFGHMFYALGVLEAFRKHNVSPNGQKIKFTCASGCVEMLLPLLMFTKDQNSTESFQSELDKSSMSPLLLLPMQFDMRSWARWVKSVAESALAPWELTPGKLFDNLSGPPGNFIFNPDFIEANAPRLQDLIDKTEVPVFTNATNAKDFSEIYLYASKKALDDEKLQTLRGEDKEKRDEDNGKPKRKVLQMTPEMYFASGARPPFLAPIEVTIDEKREYLMEGAMRCNPPLNPLIDIGADHIVLLRFFTKTRNNAPMDQNYWRAENEGALIERYLEAIFTIPLEKEIEQIQLVNRLLNHIKAQNYRHIDTEIIDPMSSKSLDFLSHFGFTNPYARQKMFEEGIKIGEDDVIPKILSHYS